MSEVKNAGEALREMRSTTDSRKKDGFRRMAIQQIAAVLYPLARDWDKAGRSATWVVDLPSHWPDGRPGIVLLLAVAVEHLAMSEGVDLDDMVVRDVFSGERGAIPQGEAGIAFLVAINPLDSCRRYFGAMLASWFRGERPRGLGDPGECLARVRVLVRGGGRAMAAT